MGRLQETPALTEREASVLRTIIKDFIQTGSPVGSRRVSKQHQEGLSAATLRNVMADLEEAGYLEQPHTSAGRIPTPQGYRFYVESLLRSKKLPFKEIEEIRRSLETESDPAQLMKKTSKLLSVYSNSIGIVLSPPISRILLKHIEFVRLSERRILMILVGGTGLVRHRLIQLDRDLSQAELDQAGRYLVQHFLGLSLVQIRNRLLRMLAEEKAIYDSYARTAIVLGTQALAQGEDESPDENRVFLGGTAHVMGRLDEPNWEYLISLLRTLEEKQRLVKIVTACLKDALETPAVTIGLEDHIPEMRNWTLITSPFVLDGETSGSLGILGPSRMEYGHSISLVDYVARLFGQIISQS